ncbi:helix-turn-helix domain-containing protein [Lacipirellula parvula]|uniref:Helix-turn-helix domain-containing protein n=1 Tax=Lacipirellula parvula TaxID=2650471 RepID=A0A5K7XFQ0_9BACT|nr:helix-turn-helix domain-containing protein [Lacipirellula parvula]BBO33063.1 hypothetical protein PLANPX_2675 [Lacipirellula parvula]
MNSPSPQPDRRPTLSDARLAFSEAETAEMLGIAKHVLRDARYRGEIRAKKIGRCWHYPKDAIHEFLAC